MQWVYWHYGLVQGRLANVSVGEKYLITLTSFGTIGNYSNNARIGEGIVLDSIDQSL